MYMCMWLNGQKCWILGISYDGEGVYHVNVEPYLLAFERQNVA